MGAAEGAVCVRVESEHTVVRVRPCRRSVNLNFEAMELTAATGLTLTAYTDTPDTPSAERLQLLANWAATHTHPHTEVPTDR